jgi:hypothetical protein
MPLALSRPDEVSAVAMAYPLLDLKDNIFVNGPAPGEPAVLRFPAEQMPAKADTIAWFEKERAAVTTKDGWDRTPYCVSTCQYGLFASKILDNRNLNRPFPLAKIEAGGCQAAETYVSRKNLEPIQLSINLQMIDG